MIHYVAGFLMDERQVLLVKKTHPPALAGSFNAVGGKVDAGETAQTAMTREFLEETGVMVGNWTEYCRLLGSGHAVVVGEFAVTFYWGWATPELWSRLGLPRLNDVGEALELCVIDEVLRGKGGVLPNVPWLLAMARGMTRGERARTFRVEEEY